MSDLSQVIRMLAGTYGKDDVNIVFAEVVSVDKEAQKCTVTAITGESFINFDAMLSAGVSDGLLVYPAVGSMVICLKSTQTLPFVVMFSDVESVSMLGSEFGGLVKVIELTQKINNLENLLNQMLLWSATVTPPFTQPQIIPTQQSEIENTTITHGS